jgi:hypothetical protein
MSDESTLQEKVREAIRAGRLPNRRPEQLWGGRGDGSECTICGKPVTPDEVEFELEFDRRVGPEGPEVHHLHNRCFAAWDLERENLAASPRSSPDSDPVRGTAFAGLPRSDAAARGDALSCSRSDGTIRGRDQSGANGRGKA